MSQRLSVPHQLAHKGEMTTAGPHNLFEDALPLPAAVLKQSALTFNRTWMKRFLAETGMQLCPHGKTTMSPQLFQMQLDDGAWGITAATAHHVRVYAAFGVKRILLANQLIGGANIALVAGLLNADPALQVVVQVDGVAGVVLLANGLRTSGFRGILPVLIELGISGKRTGVRDQATAAAVLQAMGEADDCLRWAGITLYEGVVKHTDPAAAPLLDELYARALALLEAGLAAEVAVTEPLILSAGGSVFFDKAAAFLATAGRAHAVLPLLRCGCYLTSDALFYRRATAALQARAPQFQHLGALRPALEVWAHVQSLPEPGLLVAAVGKRDISYDLEPPRVLFQRRAGAAVEAAPESMQVTALYDQHCVLAVADDHGLQVGDLLGFGMAHPCTTFDKWRRIAVVDDAYNVVDAVDTFF